MRKNTEGRGTQLHRDLSATHCELGIDRSSRCVDSDSDADASAESSTLDLSTARHESGNSRSPCRCCSSLRDRWQEENRSRSIHDARADIASGSNADIHRCDGENFNRSTRRSDTKLTFLKGKVTAKREAANPNGRARSSICIWKSLSAEEWPLLQTKNGSLILAIGIDEVEGLVHCNPKRVDLESEVRSEADTDLSHERLSQPSRATKLTGHTLLGDQDASKAIPKEDSHVVRSPRPFRITEEDGNIREADSNDLHIRRRRGLLEEEDRLDTLAEDCQGNWRRWNGGSRSNSSLNLEERSFLNIDRDCSSSADLNGAVHTHVSGVDLKEDIVGRELDVFAESRRKTNTHFKVSRDARLRDQNHAALDRGSHEDFIAIAEFKQDILKRDHDLALGRFLEDEVSSEALAEDIKEDARSRNCETRRDGDRGSARDGIDIDIEIVSDPHSWSTWSCARRGQRVKADTEGAADAHTWNDHCHRDIDQSNDAAIWPRDNLKCARDGLTWITWIDRAFRADELATIRSERDEHILQHDARHRNISRRSGAAH